MIVANTARIDRKPGRLSNPYTLCFKCFLSFKISPLLPFVHRMIRGQSFHEGLRPGHARTIFGRKVWLRVPPQLVVRGLEELLQIEPDRLRPPLYAVSAGAYAIATRLSRQRGTRCRG